MKKSKSKAKLQSKRKRQPKIMQQRIAKAPPSRPSRVVVRPQKAPLQEPSRVVVQPQKSPPRPSHVAPQPQRPSRVAAQSKSIFPVWRSPMHSTMNGWASWLSILRNQCLQGFYLIRDSRTHEVLYVGQSLSTRFYEALVRHFYSWEGPGAGPTYDPTLIEIAVVPATSEIARDPYYRFRLIQRFNPADNMLDGRSLPIDGVG